MQTDGSIGYVEYAYALQNKLAYTKMKNKDGKVVAPTANAFAAAAAGADWNSKPGYGVILANQPGAGTWPMTAATFIIMYKQPANKAESAEALKFFKWCYEHGDKMALEPRLHPDAAEGGEDGREDLDRDRRQRHVMSPLFRPAHVPDRSGQLDRPEPLRPVFFCRQPGAIRAPKPWLGGRRSGAISPGDCHISRS